MNFECYIGWGSEVELDVPSIKILPYCSSMGLDCKLDSSWEAIAMANASQYKMATMLRYSKGSWMVVGKRC